MASFTALRTSRHGKETKSYVKSHESDGAVSDVSSISPSKQGVHGENGLVNYIPKSLEIRSSDKAGRGIWTKATFNIGEQILHDYRSALISCLKEPHCCLANPS